MAHTPDLPHFFEENINLEGLFDILSPIFVKNSLPILAYKLLYYLLYNHG